MMNMSTMSPTEEEKEKLFREITEIKAIEWDLFIDRLKKSAPVPDAEIEEMRIRRKDLRICIENFYLMIDASSRLKTETRAQRRQLINLSRKLWRDLEDIYENFTEEATEVHSDPNSLDNTEQSPPPIIANTEVGRVAAASLDASSLIEATLQLPTLAMAVIPLKEGGRTKRKRRSRKKATLGPKMKMPSPRIMMKIQKMKLLMPMIILTRRMKMSRRRRIPNRVRNLLDPAPRPQCHTFLARNRVKPTNKPLYSRRQPVPGGASSLLRVRHRSSGGSKPQSRVRQAEVNSRSSNGTDEAVSVCHALYSEDPKYSVIPAVTDTYIPQDNAVRWLFHRPIT